MRAIRCLPLIAIALFADAASARVTTCDPLELCLAEIRDPAEQIVNTGSNMYEHILQFGDPAIDALVPMLGDPSAEVRERAGFLLEHFRKIDPKYLPAIKAAWQPGGRGAHGGWLPRAIAATGTDEALALLWQDFLRDPSMSSNSQIFFALGDFGGERMRPLVLARFGQCRGRADGKDCEGLFELLKNLDPPFPEWSIAPLVDLAANARSDDVRFGSEQELVRLGRAEGRGPSQARLAAFPPDTDADYGPWQARRLIDAVATYGPDSVASGPAIARFLDKKYPSNLRADAALALGKIGDRSSIPALLALAPDLDDDWVLGYNVSETLGRLHAADAEPLLRRLAADHWHRGVRNNAQRALAMLAGGSFARPEVAGDGAPYPGPRGADGGEYLYLGDLRWAGDDPAGKCWGTQGKRTIDQGGAMRWPGKGAVEIGFALPSPAVSREIRKHMPEDARGALVALYPAARGDFAAFNAGEFGGGLYYLPRSGSAQELIGEPVDAVWRLGGKLYVAAGLIHLFSDYGYLYVVDPGRHQVERTIRLPAKVSRFAVSSAHAVVLQTSEGALAVREDGTLIDAEQVAGCRPDES